MSIDNQSSHQLLYMNVLLEQTLKIGSSKVNILISIPAYAIIRVQMKDVFVCGQ